MADDTHMMSVEKNLDAQIFILCLKQKSFSAEACNFFAQASHLFGSAGYPMCEGFFDRPSLIADTIPFLFD
ncbi:MAG: hypothetical protein RR977_03035 [Oscillospiraceae bacterium]